MRDSLNLKHFSFDEYGFRNSDARNAAQKSTSEGKAEELEKRNKEEAENRSTFFPHFNYLSIHSSPTSNRFPHLSLPHEGANQTGKLEQFIWLLILTFCSLCVYDFNFDSNDWKKDSREFSHNLKMVQRKI